MSTRKINVRLSGRVVGGCLGVTVLLAACVGVFGFIIKFFWSLI